MLNENLDLNGVDQYGVVVNMAQSPSVKTTIVILIPTYSSSQYESITKCENPNSDAQPKISTIVARQDKFRKHNFHLFQL